MARPTRYVLFLTSTVALAGWRGSSGPTSGPTDCVPPVIGHRGEPAVAPEETIVSRAGVDGVLTNRTADYVVWARQQCRLR